MQADLNLGPRGFLDLGSNHHGALPNSCSCVEPHSEPRVSDWRPCSRCSSSQSSSWPSFTSLCPYSFPPSISPVSTWILYVQNSQNPEQTDSHLNQRCFSGDLRICLKFTSAVMVKMGNPFHFTCNTLYWVCLTGEYWQGTQSEALVGVACDLQVGCIEHVG